MAHLRTLVGRVLVVAWESPQHDDLVVIVDHLREATSRTGRRGLYLSVIGPKALPHGPVRDELVGFYRDVLACCDSMHVVVEGTEFESSIKRSVIAGVLLVVGARGRIFVGNTLDAVVAASPSAVRDELGAATRAAAARRLFEQRGAPAG
jgi:hypothetical protein